MSSYAKKSDHVYCREGRSTLSVDVSTDTRPIYRPSSGPHSVDISAECRSNVGSVSVDISTDSRPTLG